MDNLLFDELEKKVERLLELYQSLTDENELLREENNRLQQVGSKVRDRVDVILSKLQKV